MALQLFKMEEKIDTVSSDNIQEIVKLIHTPSEPLLELFLMVCGKLSQCIVQNPAPVVLNHYTRRSLESRGCLFYVWPHVEMLHPAIRGKEKKKKKETFLQDEKV